MIIAIKFLHIAALAIWCAGVIALPLMLAKHNADHEQLDYARLRLLTHRAYTLIVTPAAVITIAAGTALIFLAGVFTPWMFAKLVGVGMLVLLHAWIGHITLIVGERQGAYVPPRFWSHIALTAVFAAIAAILILVLAKPPIDGDLAPDWLVTPRDQPLPVDEVPM
ncbi:MAG: CopD family protein [Sphingobium sp.]